MKHTLPSVLALILLMVEPYSCQRHVSIPVSPKVLHGPAYTIVEEQPGTYLVWAKTNLGMKDALRELKCGVCLQEPSGIVLRVHKVGGK